MWDVTAGQGMSGFGTFSCGTAGKVCHGTDGELRRGMVWCVMAGTVCHGEFVFCQGEFWLVAAGEFWQG